MDFRIADTFTDSLSRLTGDEQKATKTTAFDLQMNPASAGMSFHKLDKAKDKNFWSVRVNADIRIIVHKTSASLLLCYVNHHDKAYNWAERRKLETHPKTGAAQLVEIRETMHEIVVPHYVQEQPKRQATGKKPLFGHLSDDDLLGYGVPPEWLSDVREATEDSYLILADHLPFEAAEALLEIATGGKPSKSPAVEPSGNPFDHPDAQRRFRVMTNVEELERALAAPWEKWSVFLHPEQKQLVDRDYSGPARVAGSAGTGKTVVALHRAVHLARTNPDSRVLLTTFSDTLANALRTKFRHLVWNEPRLGERIDIHSFNAIGQRLFKIHCGPVKLASHKLIRDLLETASHEVGDHKFTLHFIVTEWEEIVDAWQITSWEEYRDVARLGRKTRLPEAQRAVLWSIFEKVRAQLAEQKLLTLPTLFTQLASKLSETQKQPFDFVVVDEAQDVGIPHLRFFAALGAQSSNGLFFAGDLGQRIFQQPFSWKSLGVDIRGRSRTLKVNYRTSHQIRMQADRLLGPEVADVDGNVERRENTISVFNGPPPRVEIFDSETAEAKAVGSWLTQQVQAGCQLHELAVFFRSAEQGNRAKAACESAQLPYRILDEHMETEVGHVSLCTMHLAKGLEFRAVAVMACDDEIIPLQERIETVGDNADLQEVYDTERHLLYVACTRARDHLLVSGVEPASEFLADLTA
ncbi:MAG: DEAD/DEAH box helicase [Verrucomicrobiales bacterium]|nr:DEAD/DEAH box helicase [Verrucomicrobiales bacterium]